MTSTMAEPDLPLAAGPQLSQTQTANLNRVKSLIDNSSDPSVAARAFLALIHAHDFLAQGGVDAPAVYCRGYENALRGFFFPEPQFDAEGKFENLGSYDRGAESMKVLERIPFDLLKWVLCFTCTHPSVTNPEVQCGKICFKRERLFTHMKGHFKGRPDVFNIQKRLWVDMVTPAFFSDIPNFMAWKTRTELKSQGGNPMPKLLYKRDLLDIREHIEAKAFAVLVGRPNPDPVCALTMASSTVPAPQPTAGTGSHLPSFVSGAALPTALDHAAPVAGFNASTAIPSTPFPFSSFAHSTYGDDRRNDANSESAGDHALMLPPTYHTDFALAPPASTYYEPRAGPFPFPTPPSLSEGPHSFEHPLSMPFRSNIHSGLGITGVAKQPARSGGSREMGNSLDEEESREGEFGLVRTGRARRALAATPYDRPAGENSQGNTTAGSSHIHSSSIASHASSSLFDTVQSSTSGYNTPAPSTSGNSHLASSHSSSFASAPGEVSLGWPSYALIDYGNLDLGSWDPTTQFAEVSDAAMDQHIQSFDFSELT